MNKRQIIIVSVALGIIFASIGLSMFLSSLKEKPKVKKIEEPKKYVKTTPVFYQDIETNINSYGRVVNFHTVNLISEVPGKMTHGHIVLKEGSHFKKGTLLFTIDDSEIKLNTQSLKSNFLRDLASILPDFKIDFEPSYYEKWNKYFSTIEIENELPLLPQIESEKEKIFLATKGIFSSYYTIKSNEKRLEKYKYYAPFDGNISLLNIQSGSYVNTGANIGTIMKEDLHELKVSIETEDIPWISKDSEVEIYSNGTQQKWTGYISRISDFINQKTQTLDVYITITSNNNKIYDGQFLNASIPAQTVKNGMLIPRNIIYNNNEVFVVEDTLLKVKEINIIRLTETNAIINGLEPNANLVIEPLINAYNNMVVFKEDVKKMNLENKNSSNTNVSNSKL